MTTLSRRDALSRMSLLALAILMPARRAHGASKPFPHPDPRPDVTGDRVLKDDALPDDAEIRESFDAARRWPKIFDGLYCVCDCRDSMKHRSLLSCFESTQPIGCLGCREQSKLVRELAGKGEALADIRKAFDAKWG